MSAAAEHVDGGGRVLLPLLSSHAAFVATDLVRNIYKCSVAQATENRTKPTAYSLPTTNIISKL